MPALLAVLTLLFAEELGVPIPFAPGEVILIGAGLLVASGRIGLTYMLPLCWLAVAAGGLGGYGWSHLVGEVRLRGLARKLRAEETFNQLALRLQGASVPLIVLTRLVPGLRVYTSLVAGGSGVRFRRFALALLIAEIPWVALFLLVGIFVGVPAERLIGRVEGTALRVGAVLVILLAVYLLARRLPAARPRGGLRPPSPLLILAALSIDLAAIIVILVVFALLFGLEEGATSAASATAVVGATALGYLIVARRSTGSTLGESLLRVRYP